jgi:hypothetical protein
LRTKNNTFPAGREFAPRPRLRFSRTTHSMEPRPAKLAGTADRYAVELFRDRSLGSGIEAVLGQESNLKTALVLYNLMVAHYPDRLIMLCDGARVLARSDRQNTMATSR